MTEPQFYPGRNPHVLSYISGFSAGFGSQSLCLGAPELLGGAKLRPLTYKLIFPAGCDPYLVYANTGRGVCL